LTVLFWVTGLLLDCVGTGLFAQTDSNVQDEKQDVAVSPSSLPSPSPSPDAPSPKEQLDRDLILDTKSDLDAIEEKMFYDAKTIGMSSKSDLSFFEGEVVAIGAGSIINADKVEVDRKSNSIRASGHIVVLTPQEVFTGEELQFNWETGDFKITQALMVVNDSDKVAEVSRSLLGFSPAEMEFEKDRTERLRILKSRQGEVRNQYRKVAGKDPAAEAKLVEEYTRLLEQERLTGEQQNPAFMKMSVRHRKNFAKRRAFWEKTRSSATVVPLSSAIYLKISGTTIQRTNQNDYSAVESVFTPCKCEEDEEPAWAFHADRIEAQFGGYIDLYHPVLTIKGIPILYLPYLKMPVKSQRQSGFLVPTFRVANDRKGSVFTQPVYFDLGPDLDSTLTTDIFAERGTRLGLETRYAHRAHSGFSLNIETIRDRVWLSERDLRQQLLNYYLDQDRPYCTQEDLIERQKCENSLRDQLAIPNNTWRTAQEWRAQFFLSPRLSVVSNGQIHSDHRYTEDLNLSDEFKNILSPADQANTFAVAKAKLHYDQRDYYLGLGASFGDYVFTDHRFDGFQIPLQANLQSRLVNLDRWDILPVPLYGEMSAQNIIIKDFTAPSSPSDANEQKPLQDGTWRRASMRFISPLLRESIVRIDQFVDLEARQIEYKDGTSTQQKAQIQSWRAGLSFNLPIDGKGALPDIFQPGDWQEEGKGKYYIHHLMNWGFTLSTRPVIVRRGEYGKLVGNAPAVYFDSDRETWASESSVPVEDTMTHHKRITLFTSHRWKSLRRTWQLNPSAATAPSKKPQQESTRQRAQRELRAAMQQPDDMDALFAMSKIDDKGKDVPTGKQKAKEEPKSPFQVREYDQFEPVNLSADIAYDWDQAERRREQIAENERLGREFGPNNDRIIPYPQLAQPWSGPNFYLNLNWGGYQLSNKITYNIYERYATTVNFLLTLPAYYSTVMSLGYDIEKIPVYDRVSDASTSQLTKIRKVLLTSALIPRINLLTSLIQKRISGIDEPQYESRYGLEYLAGSGCWGLRFLRSKDFNQAEEQASYLLQLSVIFLGQQRQFDISPQLTRQLPEKDAS
jgi:hypothetical protein